jgi:hypothetical protein
MIVDTDQLITVKNFALARGKIPQWPLYHIRKGDLPHVVIDGHYFIPKSAITSWKPTPRKMGRPKLTRRTNERKAKT